MKYKCYAKAGSNDSPTLFATCDSINEAARKCDERCNGERDHACLNAIKERGFYYIGYGPSQVYVEETNS